MTSFRLWPGITIDVMSDGTATVAQVYLTTDEYDFMGAGSSHRLSNDSNDPELGELLAIQRALGNLLDSVSAKTARRIKVNDKKASERYSYRTLDQWKSEQEAARKSSMEAHPAGKKKSKRS